MSDAIVLRAELRTALSANTARLCDALRVELARTVVLEEGRPYQFEADPWSWGISSCLTEEPVTAGDWLSQALTWDWFDRAEAAGVNFDELISEELCPWFADCWTLAGGPTRFNPAYLVFHDYHDQQFDLEQRHWIPAKLL